MRLDPARLARFAPQESTDRAGNATPNWALASLPSAAQGTRQQESERDFYATASRWDTGPLERRKLEAAEIDRAARAPMQRRGRAPSGLGRAVILGVASIAFCLVAGELVQRTVLQNATMGTIHMLHTVRGIASSVLTAAVVGWSLLRSSPPLLEPAAADHPGSHARLSEKDRTAHYAHWLIQMRWVVTVVTSAMTFVAARFTTILPLDVRWPLVTTIALLAATNVFYTALASREPIPGLLQLQLSIDLVLLTVLLHFTGGVENPLSVAALFHVVFAGVLLPRRHCYSLAAFAAFLFAVMAWAEWAGMFAHHSLAIYGKVPRTLYAASDPVSVASHTAVQTAALFLTSYFVTTLTERVRGDELRMETMADRALGQRQLLEQALDTTGTGLCLYDASSAPEWVNNRWREWFGEPDAPEYPAPARLTREDLSIRVTEITQNDAKSGPHAAAPDSRVYRVTTAPIVAADGNVVQVAELATDVTQQKVAEAQMIRAGKMAAVGELAGQVAHEVNNPVAIISGKARLLLSGHRAEMSEGVAVEVDKIVALADRVAEIARGLLSYCRPSPSVRRLLDVRQPARQALSMISERARHANIQVQDLLPESPLWVEANAAELEQVFLNLFLNAIDAMPEGGRLSLSSRRVGSDEREAVSLSVEDTGHGISPELLDKIWEPFFTTKGEGHGTGLGLCICQGVVQSHGGEVRVDSVSGQGTTFCVLLPCSERAIRGELN
jgi:signal transduction histidine kinase